MFQTEGTLTVKNWITRNELECAKYEITVDMEAYLPVDSNDVTAEFGTDRVVDTAWNVAGAASIARTAFISNRSPSP